jgi:hypothetical protein
VGVQVTKNGDSFAPLGLHPALLASPRLFAVGCTLSPLCGWSALNEGKMTMGRVFIILILSGLSAALSCGRVPGASITQDELVRRTQELVNSVAGGDQGPWKKYFADDCLYFDERGRNMNKEALVADIAPLPQGYSGTISVGKAQSHIEGDTAVLSYDLNETETVYGQTMKARYHETDTWMRRTGDWQIVAAQVLRYYEDPAEGAVDVRAYADYAGIYEAAPGKTMTVSLEDGHLFRQRGDGRKAELFPEVAGLFFRKGVEGRTLFQRGSDGKVDTLIDRRNNEDVVWKKMK